MFIASVSHTDIPDISRRHAQDEQLDKRAFVAKMESAPPTYEEATVVDPLKLVARYVSSEALLAAVLVCRQWHSAFMPYLWGNPASHFGNDLERKHTAVMTFMRSLSTARAYVRCMTHALHLPPVDADRYDHLPSQWLRHVLERLPRLQSCVFRGLSSLDHGALQALSEIPDATLLDSASQNVERLLGSTVRLLDASHCLNATSVSLGKALKCFETLIYLDLSFTRAARDLSVLRSVRRLSGLLILKLRGVGLTDDAFEELAIAIGLRVKSLDVRDNQLTDHAILCLLKYCVPQDNTLQEDAEDRTVSAALPPEMLELGSTVLAIYQGEQFEDFMRRTLTSGFLNRLTIEDVPRHGLSHIYISDNIITAVGAGALLWSYHLHVVDVGSVVLQSSERRDAPCLTFATGGLTPARPSGAALKFLRIDYRLLMRHLSDEDVSPDQGESLVPSTPPGALDAPSAPALHEEPRSPEQQALPALRTLQQVSTLVLTNVPQSAPDKTVVDFLIDFIESCASAACTARNSALVDYTMPPGRRHDVSALACSEYASFALTRLRIELMQVAEISKYDDGTGRQDGSVTVDQGTDAFHVATASDFSFFGGDEPEMSDLTKETLGMRSAAETPAVLGSTPALDNCQDVPDGTKEQASFNTIQLLSAWRAERKVEHERSITSGAVDVRAEGYWDGIIQAVRPRTLNEYSDEQ